jgi:hypothetical protein
MTRKPRIELTRAQRSGQPPVFLTWLAIQQRGPLCKRWRSFPNFFRDVGNRPTWRHIFTRDDPTGAFSPTNARWRVARPYVRRRRARDAVRRGR